MRQRDSRQGADSMKGDTPASAQRGDEQGSSREEALVEDAHHDPTAFPALYAAYRPRVYRFVAAHLPCEQEAEDVTSATFEKALRALPTYQRRGTFEAWLFRIALNCVRDHVRQTQSDHHEPYILALDLPGPEDTEDAVLTTLADADVAARLQTLPRAQNEVLTLLIMADLPAREIARVVGKTEGAVRVLIHRALLTLGGGERPKRKRRTSMPSNPRRVPTVAEASEAAERLLKLTEEERRRYLCSFCGRNATEVYRLVAGPGGVNICDGCVATINELLAHEGQAGAAPLP